MADQKLTERTALTTSTDASLVHVVDLGGSYKQTKSNFLKEDRSRISNLELNQSTGVLVYETYAELPVTGTLNVSYKVTNDTTTSNNGYWHWDGSIYVKDIELISSVNSLNGDVQLDLTFVNGELNITGSAAVDLDSRYSPSTGITGSNGYLSKFTSATTLGNSSVYDNGVSVGFGTATPSASYKIDITGKGRSTDFMYSTDFKILSDRRLKTNIRDLAPNKINVKWREFEFKDNLGEMRLGVIAQELEVDYPQFVDTSADGTKSVSYTDLLIAKNAELEDRIERLEQLINNLT